MPINTKIQLRKGTDSEWSGSNPVLASGEPGYVTDSNRFKIGDGVSSWNSLSYASIVPSGFLASSGININLGSLGTSATISVSGLNSSYISDFNSAVSGLLPVKDIVAGTGIGVTSSSGVYTIAVSGVSELISEEVDDRVSQLLVEGTGVNLTYNDASGTLTIDNLHTEINILSQEPQGFVNKTDSVISFDDSSRTFTIQPAISGGSYSVYVEGTKIVKNTTETVVLGSGTALNYIHFDTTTPYALQTKTTGFNFDTDVPIAFIHWNSDINQSTFFGEERHGIRMDSVTHKWIHNTFGMQYISGLSIGGYILLGDGSSNTHAQIDISDGVLYQEDIIINITDDNGTNSANAFVQPLSPIAYIPTYYHSGSTGQWVRDIATAFPVKYNGTRAQYNLFSGGTWTTPNVTNDRFFAMWIVATNDINDPILAIVGQREDSSLNSAESNNTWSDINLTNIPTQELRPLYRLIFKTNSTYTNTPKSSLQSILDIRVAIQSTSLGVVQNDHGSLFGLADDDHSQYVHIDNARTITANHTFSNNINVSGIINANSGNFGSIQVSGTPVSVSGHTHTSSNITDFNSSVSGLLPVKNIVAGSGIIVSSATGIFTISAATISNFADNRLLTSDGTSTGINGESNLTFNGSTLTVIGSGLVSSVTGVTPNALYHIYSSSSGTTLLNVEGTNGSLFSVVDSLSGSLMSVNNSAGLPVLEVFSDDKIVGGRFNQNDFVITSSGDVGLGTASPSGKLHVVGTGIFANGLNAGNLNLDGNTVSSTNTNGPVIIAPNGSGPIQRKNTGNARGSYATDWQEIRDNVIKVASGSYSVIGGGRSNRAAGSYSTVGGGYDNTSSAFISTIGGGFYNAATDAYSVVAGGYRNTASAAYSSVCGGRNNTSSGYASTIGGGHSNTSGPTSTTTVCGGYSNIASNTRATVCGGQSNTASGIGSFVGGGQSNTASNTRATVSGGTSNTASATNSVVSGGQSNTSSGTQSAVGGGRSNAASGTYSTVPGGNRAKSTRHGELSHAAGFFASDGDAQHSILVARRTTTNATSNQVLFLDNSAARLILPAKTTWTFSVKISAYNDTDGEGGWWIIRGGIRRNGSNGTALIGSLITESGTDTSLNSASASVVADDTNEALEIRVTGVASKNIRWVAVVDISQVSYGTPQWSKLCLLIMDLIM